MALVEDCAVNWNGDLLSTVIDRNGVELGAKDGRGVREAEFDGLVEGLKRHCKNK